MDSFNAALALAGAAILATAVTPVLLAQRPLSFPMVYVGLGLAVFGLPVGLPAVDPIREKELAERISELTVVVSLMGAGLKLDRPVGLRPWSSTWRLLAVAMPLTIVATALLGWWVAGLAPVSAMLLGASLAPTDPVLASDVQVGPPGEQAEDDVRFALTSEAGLNDALAFPFTNAAVAAVGAASLGEWAGGWVVEDVLLKLAVGVVAGLVAGRALGWLVFRLPATRDLAESTEGFVALAAALLTYGVTQMLHGYGFLAVFVAACALRAHERDHEYHEVLHASAESIERLLSAALLVLLGGAIADGVLRALDWRHVAVAAALLLVVRPLSGLVSLAGSSLSRHERLAVSFFGIRGIGSIYYVAYALGEAPFPAADELWGLVALVTTASVVIHGVTATWAMRSVDRRRV